MNSNNNIEREYEQYNIPASSSNNNNNTSSAAYNNINNMSILSDISSTTDSPVSSLFSKKATYDTNVHPELRRLAYLLQSELGRHEQQIAKIQYEERKQAIERAFHAVTPLKRNKNGLNRSATGYGSPESSFRGDMSGGTNGNNSGIMNRAGASESLGSANGVLDELELVASQNGSRSNMLGLNGSNRSMVGASQGGNLIIGDNAMQNHGISYSQLFFGAALQLLEEESEKRRNTVGMTKTDFQQLIKSGILEKSHGKLKSGARKYNFVKKIIEVKAGRLLYYKYTESQGMKPFGNLFGKKESEKEDSVYNNGGNMATHKGEEKLIDFSQGQYLVFPYDDVKNIGPGLCFVLYNVNDEKDARLWKAADPKSCAYWMTAIRTAIRISRSTTTSSGDVKICNQMRKEIMGATIASEYVSILKRRMRNNYAYRSSNNNNDDDDGATNNNHADGLRVPVAWVHSEMEKMDSNYLNAIENDMTIEQMKKDMLRDTFQIDGLLLHGVDGVENIIGTLAAHILHVGESMDLKEIHAVRFAREVLYECSRSQFGGDCFYTARFLFSSDAMDLVITPQHAAQPLPIIFTVALEPYMEEINFLPKLKPPRKSLLNNLLGAKYDDALRSNQHQSALLTVHMEASMVFEMNDMDLSNDGKLATIETKFKRSFVFAGESPVAVGAGNIHVSFKESIASS